MNQVAQFAATIRFLGLDGGNSDSNELPADVSEVFNRGRMRELFGKMIHEARISGDYARADELRQIAIKARFDVKSQKDRTYLDENLDSDYEQLSAFIQ